MACCYNNRNPSRKNEREIPDGIDPCCNVRGQRCMCLPYDDPWVITAQILTIVSVFFAWICWVTFLVGFIGLILFQILWCVRMRGGALIGQTVIAALTSLANLGIALYILIAWRNTTYCEVFIWYASSYYYEDDAYSWPNYDDCAEKTWFAIALVCSLLWGGASCCLAWFVKSGRHAKWEKKYVPSDDAQQQQGLEITATPSNVVLGNAEEQAVVADAAVLETEKDDSVELY